MRLRMSMPTAQMTRQDALDSGLLIDASTGALGVETRRLYPVPVAMTAAVWNLIADVPDPMLAWWDIVWMSVVARIEPVRFRAGRRSARFVVRIKGDEANILRVAYALDDHEDLTVTILMADEA